MQNTNSRIGLREFKTIVNMKWPEISVDDLEMIEEDPDRLIDVLQDTYHMSQDDADFVVSQFEDSENVPDFDSKVRRRYLHV